MDMSATLVWEVSYYIIIFFVSKQTHVLAGEKVVHVKAVQLQLSNAHHDITACQTVMNCVFDVSSCLGIYDVQMTQAGFLVCSSLSQSFLIMDGLYICGIC